MTVQHSPDSEQQDARRALLDTGLTLESKAFLLILIEIGLLDDLRAERISDPDASTRVGRHTRTSHRSRLRALGELRTAGFLS